MKFMLSIKAKIRENIAKQLGKMRKSGFIPAVVYGHKKKTLHLSVNYHDFAKIYEQAGESTLIDLDIDDKKQKVLIHDVQKDPVTDKFIHADFYQVKMDEEIKAEVALEFIGSSPVVEDEDGILVKNFEQVEVEALPMDLPHDIKVDLSKLKTFDDNICIKDLEILEKVKIMADPDTVVVSVVPPRTKEEIEELDKEVEEKVEEVEGVKKEGEEDVEEGKEESASNE